jgi:cytochrome b involved in lipid metabolism
MNRCCCRNYGVATMTVSLFGAHAYSADGKMWHNTKKGVNWRVSCLSYSHGDGNDISGSGCGLGKALPTVYTPEEVQCMDGTNGTPFWVTYRGEVFDLTGFKAAHPGGKWIEQTAGTIYNLNPSVMLSPS